MLTTFVLVCAVMFLLTQLNNLGWGGCCPDCGGRGDHSDDCWRKR